MKILFVNTQMSTGGIATSLINLCEGLKVYKDIQIDVLLLNPKCTDIKWELPDNVNIIRNNNKKLCAYLTPLNEIIKSRNVIDILNGFNVKIRTKIFGIKKTLDWIMSNNVVFNGYDVSISFRNDEYKKNGRNIFGCNKFVLKCTNANKKIAWIHNDPKIHGFTYEIAKEEFKDFDEIVNVSQGCKEIFDQIIPEYKYKSRLVYNTFNENEILERSKEFNPYKHIDENIVKFVTVGRIKNEHKRIDRVVKICKKLKDHNIHNYVWYIIGDGPDLSNIKHTIDNYELNSNIKLLGRKYNPYPYMKYADCFVMSSATESFGMTLVESLIVGTPVITTNHIAASEIVNHNKNGFITENSTNGIEDRVKFILKERNLLNIMKINTREKKISENTGIVQFLDMINYK